MIRSAISLCLCILSSLTIAQQRDPVLKQIDVPHDYYFREMYLPQVTTGPSAMAWSPDGEELVYSMGGSLWRQKVDESVAKQLTAGPGYDYQPDWSPDGSTIVFTRYNGDAVEIQLLNLATGKVSALTSGGDVNLEPRFSPDGTKLAYVTTKNTGHFRIWIGDLKNGKLEAKPITPERKTQMERYYYSQYDHQLSPTWSPDGESIILVTNPDNIYGTGPIYRMDLNNRDELILIQKEETAWHARPDWSRDGKRVVYSSYLGRQWNQLWVTTSTENGNPLPLTYGEFDATSPRWSPDANRIAYISNENGNTSLQIFEVLGGKHYPLPIQERHYLNPTSTLTIKVLNEKGEEIPARISIVAADGRAYAPDELWLHADDAFDRTKQKFETHYFHSMGTSTTTLPTGKAEITVWHGLENKIQKQTVEIIADKPASVTVTVPSFSFPVSWSNWISGDVHVHMNYGGHYRNTPAHMVEQAEAEDLDIVFNLVVNKEQRIPDMAYFTTAPDKASNEKVLLLHGQEHHTSYWGHMGLLGLNDHYLIPGYTTYPNTAVASPHPSNSVVANLAHEQNALVGYVHPFYEIPNPEKEEIHHALPIDVALGHIDYYETVGFSYHRPSAEVWYRLLNCGFRISAAAGTDAMANYASLRGPVGVDRTYVEVKEQTNDPVKLRKLWLQGLKAGHSLATNGPLLGLTLNERGPGEEIQLKGRKNKLTYKGFMRSIVPIDHLEIVNNGKVIKTISLIGDKTTADFDGTLTIEGSGWVLLRAWNDTGTLGVLDFYPYGTTNPTYLIVNDKPIRSGMDADYFIRWIDRVAESAGKQTYLNTSEKELTLTNIEEARKVFESRK